MRHGRNDELVSSHLALRMRPPAASRVRSVGLAACLGALLVGCLDAGESPGGLALTPPGSGPKVVFDLDAEPLPDIPFPNDLASRLDPTSPTGRRINVSEEAPTALERQVRRRANQLTGFGSFAPINVGFDAPIDLCNIARRHHLETPPEEHVVLVVNLTPGEQFGEIAEVDLGRGHFPLQLRNRTYFERDVPGENTLFADVPLPDCGAVTWQYDQNTFYEHETNTLMIRPVRPLREASTYGVVLTRHLHGLDGAPIRSPFGYVNHTRQTPVLRRLEDALPAGVGIEDIAFAWSFTTQDATGELHDLRRGLYGHGPFARLGEEFPPQMRLHELWGSDARVPDNNPYIITAEKFIDVLEPVIGSVVGEEAAAPLIETFDYVDFLFSGTVRGPNFLVDRSDLASDSVGCEGDPRDPGWDCRPGVDGTHDEVFDIDRHSGRMHYGEHEIDFWCAVPHADRKQDDGPFPVVIYGHGYGSSRLEMLGFAGSHARMGLATCAIDAFGHGMVIPSGEFPPSIIRGLFEAQGIGGVMDAIIPGRARDLNNDGEPNAGGDFWTADTFHTRDIVRQSVLDHMVFLRVLRSFGDLPGFDLNGDGNVSVLGDFNVDGQVDLGGPNVTYHAWGQSLGGILSAVFAGSEPHLTAAAPTAGGAGLLDIGVRSVQGGVREAVYLPIFGPLMVGEPTGEGTVRISALISDVNRRGKVLLDHAPGPDQAGGLQPGDGIRLSNLTNGEVAEGVVAADGGFRLAVTADAIDPLRKRHLLDLEVVHFEHDDWTDFSRPPRIGQSRRALAVTDTEPLGDRLVLEVCQGPCPDTELTVEHLRYRLDTFRGESNEGRTANGDLVPGEYFQGTIYASGSPLVALASGWAHQRQRPRFRQFRDVAAVILEAADPAAYARFYLLERDRFEARWEGHEPDLDFGVAVNVVNTVGDMNVPVNTGIMIAYAAGFVTPAQMRYLIDNFVMEGVFDVRADVWGAPILFDADNLSQGTDGLSAGGVPVPRAPAGQEVRATLQDGDRIQAMRLPYLRTEGEHGFYVPEPDLAFDPSAFMIHQLSRYFLSGGTELSDELCMQDASCAWIPE